MDLNEIAIFVKVVQAGSFSSAAKELGLPNSTVSAKVSSLEGRLGVTLIERTTRKLSVTDAGKAFFTKCLAGLQELKGAEDELHSSLSEPQGLIKVSAPIELGNFLYEDLIHEFTQKYPKVSVELVLSDRRVDLMAEGIDLALRVGILKDSSLIAKELGVSHFELFASPTYIEQAGEVKTPEDLHQRDCLVFTRLGPAWNLKSDKREVDLDIHSRVTVNDLNLLKKMTLSGGGICLLPSFICYEDIHTHKLQRVLPGWISRSTPVHYVYPAQKFVKPKLKAFITFTAEVIKKRLKDTSQG